MGTIHTPRPANISPSAAVIYLGDYLGLEEESFLSPACHLNMQQLEIKLVLKDTEDEMDCGSISDKDTKNDEDDENDRDMDKDENKEKNEEKCSSKSYTECCTISMKSVSSAKEGSTTIESEEEKFSLSNRVGCDKEKKYLHLPVEYCDQSPQGHDDFCFNIPYKKLIFKMQKTKEKLHHLLATSGCIDNEDNASRRSCNSADVLSIGVANKCMKKYIFDMTLKECNAVNGLLVAAHGYIAALCGNLTTDRRAWKEWYVNIDSRHHFFLSIHSTHHNT